MKNNYYESPKSSYLMRLFWRAAGADQYLLERSTYSDQIKYFCLGGIVVATGAMAGLAGGYAIYTIFEPKGDAIVNEIHMPTVFMSIIFGIIWGLMIYNIDRFIVTSTGKGDGTERITRREFVNSIPRLIMGLIIAITISKPIEIRMFKPEIDKAIFDMQQDFSRKEKVNIKASFQEKIDELDAGILKLESEVSLAANTYQKYDNAAVQEWEGKSGTGQSGDGPAYRMKRQEANNYKSRWRTIEKQNLKKIAKKEKEKENIEQEMENELDLVKLESSKMDGLLLRLQLAHKIAGFWISLFITLLFMVIELTPIIFKMMLIKGPYDYMDENVKELARAEAGIEIVYNFYEGEQGMEAHKIVNHGAELKSRERRLILAAQEELNREIVKKWKEKKMKDIGENPENYISEE